MPKKGKKGKKGKGGKKSGGKKGGKKGGKDAKKKREENIAKLAVTNSSIWEMRLEAMEKSKVQFRETMIRLAGQNSELHDTLLKSEKDAIDVINYMKNDISSKEEEISTLQEDMVELKSDHKKEKELIITEMSEQISKLDEELKEKNNDILLLKKELHMVNEFRKKRNQLNQEFIELKEALHHSNKEHQDVIGKMERKFFEEKMRIQVEANKKISELADQAHKEAIENLDEATRSVFKENVRANEALKYHIKNTEKQREKVKKLKEKNSELEADKNMLDEMVTKKVAENKQLKEANNELSSKVSILEKALTQSTKEYDDSNETLRQLHENELDSSKKEIEKCKRLLDLRTQELKKIRCLAKQVLHQRSEVEQFFLNSLELVKEEIVKSQNQYKKDAQSLYQQKMMLAQQGKSEFPPVRTFNQSKHSTNSVYQDLEEAVKMMHTTNDQVDISELTWEQRERVLRYLFVRMNSTNQNSKSLVVSSQPIGNDCRDNGITLPPISGSSHHSSLNSLNRVDLEGVEIEEPVFLTQTGLVESQ